MIAGSNPGNSDYQLYSPAGKRLMASDKRHLPNEIIGEAMVFKTYDKLSMALVLRHPIPSRRCADRQSRAMSLVMMPRLADWLALVSLPGIGPYRAQRLLARFDPTQLRRAPAMQPQAAGLTTGKSTCSKRCHPGLLVSSIGWMAVRSVMCSLVYAPPIPNGCVRSSGAGAALCRGRPGRVVGAPDCHGRH